MKKILFMIPNLGGGGAEKVLVNLANSLHEKGYSVTILLLCNEGVNRQFVNKGIRIEYVFRHKIKAIKHILKIVSPSFLFRQFIKEKYDCIIPYLEGEMTRIASGCSYETKILAWIHTEKTKDYEVAFKNKNEVLNSYKRFDNIICVSKDVSNSFNKYTNGIFKNKLLVIKNVNDYKQIERMSKEAVEIDDGKFNIIGVGRLTEVKDFGRLVPIIKRINADCDNIELYILGEGEEKDKIEESIKINKITNIHLLGYQQNPYKYVSKCDLFVLCSHKEGYNTAVNEALYLNIPIVATDCGGMKELLDKGKYGLIVRDDNQDFYEGILELIKNNDYRISIKHRQTERIAQMKSDNDKIVERTIEAIER